MALHDVDRTNSDRSIPKPNAPDPQRAGRMAHGTTSFNPVTDATNATGVDAGSGTLRVVWQKSDQVRVQAGAGTQLIRYSHNLGQTPFIFCSGQQIHGNVTSYIAAINNDITGGFSLALYNDTLNSFLVGYDDIDTHIGGDDTIYFVLFKACLFQ